MRARKILVMGLAGLAVSLMVGSNLFAQKSYDSQLDIAALMKTAQEKFDLPNQDAVILSEGQSVRWSSDGRLTTVVHRIVWINSEVAVNRYADSRIPYDKDHCTFTPLVLRTWRDNEWWPTDSTGFVETLPFQLEAAYDYTNMREIMLLHNGIAIPCIVEMAYRIEDKTPFRKGTDGVWLFNREEPAVESWFEMAIPAGSALHATSANGAPESQKSKDTQAGLDLYRWSVGPIAAQPRPHVSDPTSDLPYIAWTTWDSKETLTSQILSVLQSGAELDPALKLSLDSLKHIARTHTELAKLISTYINDHITSIHYPESFWWSLPRPANRIFSTAYGHRIDRAIIASTLFNSAGLNAHPEFIALGSGAAKDPIPILARFDGVLLHVRGENLDGYYDPLEGTFSAATSRSFGRYAWAPGASDPPDPPASAVIGQIETHVSLTYDKDRGKFVGNGVLTSSGGLSTFERVQGVGGEAKDYLNSLAASLTKGSTVTSYNPDRFDESATEIGFDLEIAKPDPDDYGRIAFVIGKPVGGIIDHLPADVQLYVSDRQSAVTLPYPMTQKVEFRLDLKPWQVVYRPTDVKIENAAGQFSVTALVQDSQLVVVRTLKLSKTTLKPEEWPMLRQLLLAENHDRNRTILLKAK